MRPNPKFLRQDKPFWAAVRSLSQEIGYTVRGEGAILIPNLDQMAKAYVSLGLDPVNIKDTAGNPTPLAQLLKEYFTFRAEALKKDVEPNLMDAAKAKSLFDSLYAKLQPTRPIPMNKQKGEKKSPAYLTGIIMMLIEKESKNAECDYDPRKLTTITKNGAPIRTFARRVDGAFPTSVNPIAVWEIKEYYYTTTFGSRVADGVYESLLDGMEIEELREHEAVDVKHYLFVDAHYTWWTCGKSYLCRLIDMLHMGYVDEILFGKEVVQEMPRIVKEWMEILVKRKTPTF